MLATQFFRESRRHYLAANRGRRREVGLSRLAPRRRDVGVELHFVGGFLEGDGDDDEGDEADGGVADEDVMDTGL